MKIKLNRNECLQVMQSLRFYADESIYLSEDDRTELSELANNVSYQVDKKENPKTDDDLVYECIVYSLDGAEDLFSPKEEKRLLQIMDNLRSYLEK